jgi:hypothetical protein
LLQALWAQIYKKDLPKRQGAAVERFEPSSVNKKLKKCSNSFEMPEPVIKGKIRKVEPYKRKSNWYRLWFKRIG